jgi:hypothetical protein
MKVITFLVLAMGFGMTGCSTTHYLNFGSPDEYGALNKFSRTRIVQVVLQNGQAAQVTELRARPDSCIWNDIEKGVRVGIATQDIRSLTVVRKNRGTIDGLLAGLLGGAAVGIVVTSVGYDESNSMAGHGAETMGGAVIFGVIGALIGMPVGHSIGHRDAFILGSQEDSDRQVAPNTHF